MLGFWVRFVAAVVGSLRRVTCHYKFQRCIRVSLPMLNDRRTKPIAPKLNLLP